MTYEEWLKKVDGFVAAKLGVTTADLEDADHYSAFEEDVDPESYAKDFVSDYLYDHGMSEDFGDD